MVKELTFDLHFTATVIKPLTTAGLKFCQAHDEATPAMYQAAVDAGLHVRFENAFVRDWVTERKITRKEAV